MSTKSRTNSLEILKGISQNSPVFLEDGDESRGFFFREFVTNDYGRLYITILDDISEPRR